jgi:hypothetical protein
MENSFVMKRIIRLLFTCYFDVRPLLGVGDFGICFWIVLEEPSSLSACLFQNTGYFKNLAQKV